MFNAVIRAYVRRLASLFPAKYKFEKLYPVGRSWGSAPTTSTPKKQNTSDAMEGDRVSNEKAEPIVAFSRPPPLPPVLGPLVAISLLETWSGRDGDDD